MTGLSFWPSLPVFFNLRSGPAMFTYISTDLWSRNICQGLRGKPLSLTPLARWLQVFPYKADSRTPEPSPLNSLRWQDYRGACQALLVCLMSINWGTISSTSQSPLKWIFIPFIDTGCKSQCGSEGWHRVLRSWVGSSFTHTTWQCNCSTLPALPGSMTLAAGWSLSLWIWALSVCLSF